MFGMFGGFGLGGGTFDSNYRAYPVSFIDKNDAEHADKVFLPPSALDRLGMQLLKRLIAIQLPVVNFVLGCSVIAYRIPNAVQS